jgi:hypothetical protein
VRVTLVRLGLVGLGLSEGYIGKVRVSRVRKDSV